MADPHPARPGERPEREDKRSLFQKLVEFIRPGPDSTDELIGTLAEAEDNEVIDAESRVMLEGVLRMADMTAGDAMVAAPRMDLLDIDAPYEDMLLEVIRTAHSRFPVYQGERENIIGILLAKDLLKLQRAPELNVRTLLRPAVFVPESKGLNELLRAFRVNRNHLAIVVDEFGRTAGLITIEDVLEEIVGEMRDEHDHDEPEVEVVEAATGPDGEGMVVRVPARTPIDEAGELFDLEIEDDDVDTVGGLLAKALGKVPIVGNEVDALGLHLVAERVEGRRKQVSTVLVSRTEVREDDDHAPDRDGERVAARAVGSRDLPGHEAQEDRAR